MNIYNKKQIKCSACGKFLGEIDNEAKIAYPLCGKCSRKETKLMKTGIKKILVPLDDSLKSTKALDTSIYLAKHFGAKVVVLHVIPNLPYEEFQALQKVKSEMLTHAKNIVDSAKNYCLTKNFPVSGKISRGDDEAATILKTSSTEQFDLIIMGSSGKGVLKEVFMGSISNFVLQKSKVPVLMVKEASKKLQIKP